MLTMSMVLIAHPIKMSTGKLEINTTEKTCRLTLNFFIDDFKTALKEKVPMAEFDFQQPGEFLTGTIQQYITDNFGLMLDKQAVSFTIEKIDQIEQNVCQLILHGETKNIAQFEVATIKDALLFSSFSKQSNILHLIINNEKPQILQFYKAVPVRKVKIH